MDGLQYKENLTIISGGFPGEDVGSNGVEQDWTDAPGTSGSSDVTYYFHDSTLLDNNNSSRVDVRIAESWTAQLLPGNIIRLTVTVSIPSITRTRIGNPSAYSTYLFVRQTAGGADVWNSGGCDDATTTHTIATNINVGTYIIDLPPESSGSERGTVYFRSNACGHNGDTPPSQYIDEFWLGINFRNVLPKDFIPDAVYDGEGAWLSHNRAGGDLRIYDGSKWSDNLRTVGDGTEMGNPPSFYSGGKWYNRRRIGKE